MIAAVYDPHLWYWLADDNRVFSGPQQLQVPDTDPDYVAFKQLAMPTQWPRDPAGDQTDAALQDVLTPYGMFASLAYYSANARYSHASGGVIVLSISPVAFTSDVVSRNTLANADAYAKANPGTMTDWKLSDGSFVNLSEAQLAAALDAMATFVQSCFTCESNTATGIGDGSITAQAEVDAAYAAISNVFT